VVCSLLGECWEEEEEYTERLFILGLVHHPLSHPHHTGLIIPHTLRHRREVFLRTQGPRRESEESSSPHTGTDLTKVPPHTLGQLAEISHT